jgi:hypothetical protein
MPCSLPRATLLNAMHATAYKNAATNAPKPSTLPAAALTLAAAPVPAGAAALPVLVVRPADPDAPEPEPAAPVPLADRVDVWTRRVVLLFAMTTTVRVWLNMEPVPGRTSVCVPGPTAGMPAGRGWDVTTAGCEVTTEG